MGFILFVLVNATLFIRPAEIVPELLELPIYNVLMSSTILATFPAILRQLRAKSLISSPITVCVLGLQAMVILSHLGNGNTVYARMMGFEFFKIVLYYLVLVALLDTPAKFLRFTRYLVGLITIMVTLTLLHYSGQITLPAMETLTREEVDASTGEVYNVLQIQGTGIFSDPNDLCLILVIGMGICLHAMSDRRSGVLRATWAVPLMLFGYTLALTHSRGGFLALLTGMMVTIIAKFGARRSLPLLVLGLPAMFVLFAGRQTNISTSSGTGQARIQLWAAGMDVFRQRPFFGVGQGLIAEEITQETHNSFVHCYPDMGFLGGTLFLALYGVSVATVYRLGSQGDTIADPGLRQFRPYLMGVLAAYIAGMSSISRAYIAPTYLLPGLVATYAVMAVDNPPIRFDARFVRNALIGSVAFLVGTHFYIRIFARWG